MKFWKFIPVTAIVILSSCSKGMLTIEPENRTVSEGYYNSAQRIQQAVIGGYVDLRRALLANYAWMMYGEARAGDLNVAVSYQPLVVKQELTADNLNLSQLADWGYFYDVIRDANELLDIIAGADEETLNAYQRKLYRGEALALKSIAYFYLTRIWGDIPSAEKNNFGKRLTSTESVAQAAQWAAEAKELLPWILLNDDGIESIALTAVRFNKTAITTLLAQQELWLNRGQNAYDILTSTFTPAVADSLSGFGLSNGADRRTEIPQNPLSSSVVRMSLDKLNAIYPVGDARRTRLFNISSSQATLIVRDAGILELLSVNEIGLLLAEAAWRSSHLDEAKDYLIKTASGATEDYSILTENTFEEALLLERQRILVGKGQRVFDLIRFGKVSNYIAEFTPDDVEKGAAYWPLSANSMKGNSWSQNNYWTHP